MTKSLWFILLMAILSIVTLASAPDTMTGSTTLARPDSSSKLPQNYMGTSSPLPHRGNFLSGSWTSERGAQWGVHLALQLVKRPKLNQEQARIILDAISVAAASDDLLAKGVNDDLQALRRRAIAAFPKHEVANLFANIGKAEQDALKMYYDISALPLKQRKASFRNASSNDKSDLWRTHLALFLVKRPELNEQQKATILAAISLVTPENFEVRSSSPAWEAKVRKPLRSLEEEILATFSFNDAVKIFATLGDDLDAAKRTPTQLDSLLSTITYERLSDTNTYKKRVYSRAVQQDMMAERGEPCQCSTDSDWCPLSGYCSGTSCSPTQSGCGTLWTYPCNGASCR